MTTEFKRFDTVSDKYVYINPAAVASVEASSIRTSEISLLDGRSYNVKGNLGETIDTLSGI